MTLSTTRLRLIPATPDLIRADLRGAEALAAALGAPVATDWPPAYYDRPAMEYSLDQLQRDPASRDWTFYFVQLGTEAVAGIAGYKGPPAEDGSVEIGYSVVPGHQRRGIAAEAAGALVARAFRDPRVQRVIAETLPPLLPSIRVLEKNGFRPVGEGSEPGVIRFELSRDDFSAGRVRVAPHLRHLVRLLGHLAWADARALDALGRGVPPDPRALSLLGHVLGAEHVWLSRLRGEPAGVPVWPDLDVDACQQLSLDNELGFREFIFPLTPADLRRGIDYRNSAGQEFVTEVEDILLHVFLHGAYHRGQVAQWLRIGGHTPEPTDYIAFARGAAAALRAPG